MPRLEGKAALVTGGSRGIGAAIAKRLGSEGASVVITYSSSAKSAEAVVEAIEAEGGRSFAIQADNSDVSAIKAAVTATVNAFGCIDVLVNNAAISRLGLISDYLLEDFDQMISVNIKGLFVATQESIRYMRKGGRIINIGSISSDFMPISGASVYAMTKGAVASFTRGLARDLGPRGITVNNVQPGRVDTDMLHSVAACNIPSAQSDMEMDPPNRGQADKLLDTIAVRRLGMCDEVAGLVAYLASPEAAFVTGANIKVDGGASV